MGPDYSNMVEAVEASKLVDGTLSVAVLAVSLAVLWRGIQQIRAIVECRRFERDVVEWHRRSKVIQRAGGRVTPF